MKNRPILGCFLAIFDESALSDCEFSDFLTVFDDFVPVFEPN